jgi:Carboxypeptidase regulatory-like domain/TonB dependent receptor-like, beta-barrel
MAKQRGRPVILAALMGGVLLVGPVLAEAQVTGATLSGTVSDPTNAVIPNAEVSALNTATGVIRNTTTNSAGLYNAPNLSAGPYQVTVSAQGFQTEVRSGITLTVGAEQVVNIEMRVGLVTQKVQVTGAAPAVELASSTLRNVVGPTTVLNLPLNGRDWTQLAQIEPGVNVVRGQDHTAGGQPEHGNGVMLTISGGRPGQNNYRLNGITINDFANTAPGSALGQNLGVDAVQEFSVITSAPAAEYGRSSGGIVNAITRGGTNAFHGTAYEFLRNNALDAANFFDNSANLPIPPFRRNQFGASAGGPIRKDRTWIFGDYEGFRQALTTTTTSLTPSAAARTGNFCSIPGAGCTPSTVAPDPTVAKYLTAFYPLPNQPLTSPGDVGEFIFSSATVSNENYWTTRLDHRFSDKDSVFGTYLYDNASTSGPDEFKNKDVGNTSNRQMVTLEEDHVFSPRLLNAVRLGYNRIAATCCQTLTVLNPALNDLSFAFIPGVTVGEIDEPDINSFTGKQEDATANWYNSYQVYDDAFLTKGRHALKFGAAFERIQSNFINQFFNSGDFMWNTLPGFVSNDPTQLAEFDAPFPGTDTYRGLRETVFATYLQDELRLRPNLAVTLGLRYEIATVPTEVHGKLAALRTIYDAQPHIGSHWFSNPTFHNFEPRIGLAWDPFGTGKTSVRSGFGLYDVLPLPYIYANPADRAAPFFKLGTTTSFSAGAFPDGAFSTLVPSTLRQLYVEPNPPRSYVIQYNLSVQREITPSATVMIAFAGSRGIHLMGRNDNVNEVLPTQTAAGLAWPLPIGSGTRLNPNWARLAASVYNGNSFYDAFELQVVKRMSHGLQAQAAYTWGKSIDDGSVVADSGEFLNSVQTPYNFFDKKLNRGPSDFNVAQNLVINVLWNVPTPASWSGGPARWLSSGWQLGGIYTATSGTPFTPILGCNVLGDPACSSLPDHPNRVVGPGCNTLSNPGNPNQYIKLQCLAFPNPSNILGNLGRNTVVGPGLSDLDFSVIKDTPVRRVSENFKVEFRAEFFNIMNRANFQLPLDNLTVFDGSGNPVPFAGLIDATATSSRQIQFGLKLIW